MYDSQSTADLTNNDWIYCQVDGHQHDFTGTLTFVDSGDVLMPGIAVTYLPGKGTNVAGNAKAEDWLLIDLD